MSYSTSRRTRRVTTRTAAAIAIAGSFTLLAIPAVASSTPRTTASPVASSHGDYDDGIGYGHGHSRRDGHNYSYGSGYGHLYGHGYQPPLGVPRTGSR